MTGLGLATDTVAERCASWTRGQGVDPIGSAGTYDTPEHATKSSAELALTALRTT